MRTIRVMQAALHKSPDFKRGQADVAETVQKGLACEVIGKAFCLRAPLCRVQDTGRAFLMAPSTTRVRNGTAISKYKAAHLVCLWILCHWPGIAAVGILSTDQLLPDCFAAWMGQALSEPGPYCHGAAYAQGRAQKCSESWLAKRLTLHRSSPAQPS